MALYLKVIGRNGKSKIFRILEKILGEENCSHEHLEDLSGNRLGAKSTVKYLERKVCQYSRRPNTTKVYQPFTYNKNYIR